ncbi:hypothetical protein [Salarchaeum japonicum]|uniref:Uncharacterized protein n=1 Tax=Salarchaeum japonicum TaxID=555573 RepID=A0AAV3T4G5_9EURY|nr:hypothetical protein [Salarchaeum japonicum]
MVTDESGFAVPAGIMVFLTIVAAVPVLLPGSFWPLLLVGLFAGAVLGGGAYWLVERLY